MSIHIRIRNWTTKRPGKCRTLCSNVYFIHHPIQYVASNSLSCISPPLQEKKSVTTVYSLNNGKRSTCPITRIFTWTPALQRTYKWTPLIKYSGSLAATRRASELAENAISVLRRKAVFRNNNYFFRFRFWLLTSYGSGSGTEFWQFQFRLLIQTIIAQFSKRKWKILNEGIQIHNL